MHSHDEEFGLIDVDAVQVDGAARKRRSKKSVKGHARGRAIYRKSARKTYRKTSRKSASKKSKRSRRTKRSKKSKRSVGAVKLRIQKYRGRNKRRVNSWVRFEHRMGQKGLTRPQIRRAYRAKYALIGMKKRLGKRLRRRSSSRRSIRIPRKVYRRRRSVIGGGKKKTSLRALNALLVKALMGGKTKRRARKGLKRRAARKH
jgi:hypothetical protein